MISRPSTLPDDPVDLKKIIVQLAAENASLREQHEAEKQQPRERYEEELDILHEQIRQLYDHVFGRKSEKFFGSSPQLLLFDMPEVDPEPELAEKIEVEAHSREKSGRKPLPEKLPRVEVVHDIAEEKRSAAVVQRWSVSVRRSRRSSISFLRLPGSSDISDRSTAVETAKG